MISSPFQKTQNRLLLVLVLLLVLIVMSCKLPSVPVSNSTQQVPGKYQDKADTANSALLPVRQFYTSAKLQLLIDTVLARNYDLAIALRRIEISRAAVMQAKGPLRPQANAQLAPGIRKFG